MERETGAKIIIRGKGSVKEGKARNFKFQTLFWSTLKIVGISCV